MTVAVHIKQINMTDPLYQGERQLRNIILMRPIGLPDFGWEMRDADSFHFVAVDEDKVIGCAILYPLPEQPGVVQLMQMAVAADRQGERIGSRLVAFMIAFAGKSGITSITCHARDLAIPFYEKLGFESYGEPFEEAGVMHEHMRIAT